MSVDSQQKELASLKGELAARKNDSLDAILPGHAQSCITSNNTVDAKIKQGEEFMKKPEEILQEGITLCQNGNLIEGISHFKLSLENSARPGMRMVLNHNIAYALSLLSEVQLGPGGSVRVDKTNVEYLEEAADRWDVVCKIYEQEVKGTSEEQEFSGPPSLKEYMKTALSWGFALRVKIDEFRGTGLFKK